MSHHKQMIQLAIDEGRRYQTPFAAVITMGMEVAATTHHTTGDDDPTAHAIVNGLRELANLTREITFPGYTLYSTVEPCLMCAGACMHSQLGEIYFGITQKSAAEILGFDHQDSFPLFRQYAPAIAIHPDMEEAKVRQLFLDAANKDW